MCKCIWTTCHQTSTVWNEQRYVARCELKRIFPIWKKICTFCKGMRKEFQGKKPFIFGGKNLNILNRFIRACLSPTHCNQVMMTCMCDWVTVNSSPYVETLISSGGTSKAKCLFSGDSSHMHVRYLPVKWSASAERPKHVLKCEKNQPYD